MTMHCALFAKITKSCYDCDPLQLALHIQLFSQHLSSKTYIDQYSISRSPSRTFRQTIAMKWVNYPDLSSGDMLFHPYTYRFLTQS